MRLVHASVVPALGLLMSVPGCGEEAPSAPLQQAKGGASEQSSQAGQEDLSVIPLGTLGGEVTQALDLNDRGMVVGWSEDGDGHQRPFKWTPRTGMIDLGTLGGDEAVAMAVNNRGLVVGWSRDPEARQLATRWTGAGEAQAMEAQELGPEMSAAVAINNQGVSVGYTIGLHPARWAADGTALGLLDGCSGGYPFDVNDTGEVAGVASTIVGSFIHNPISGGTHEYSGFRWKEGEECEGLIDESFVAYDVRGINNRGELVGLGGEWEELEPPDSYTITLRSAEVPFVHEPTEGFRTDLELPAEPRAINNRGTVVGDGMEAVNEEGDRVGGGYLWTHRPQAFAPRRQVWEGGLPRESRDRSITAGEPAAARDAPDEAHLRSCPEPLRHWVEIRALPACPGQERPEGREGPGGPGAL